MRCIIKDKEAKVYKIDVGLVEREIFKLFKLAVPSIGHQVEV